MLNVFDLLVHGDSKRLGWFFYIFPLGVFLLERIRLPLQYTAFHYGRNTSVVLIVKGNPELAVSWQLS